MDAKEWTIVVKIEGQPAGAYTVTIPADKGDEFSKAHLELLQSFGLVDFVAEVD